MILTMNHGPMRISLMKKNGGTKSLGTIPLMAQILFEHPWLENEPPKKDAHTKRLLTKRLLDKTSPNKTSP